MNPLKEQYEIKSVPDFEASIAKGEVYTGLVEGVGYVYWKNEAMYFIHVNSNDPFGRPQYQQVPGPYFIVGGRNVITQTVRRLYILPKEDLMEINYDMYYQFYVLPKELRKQICETDAIQSKTESEKQKIKEETDIEKLGLRASNTKKALDVMDTTSGILEDVGVIKLPKWLPYAKVGVTGVFVAIDRYVKGDYVNAAGEVMQALNPYGTFFDIGVAMMNSNLMQRRMAEQYAIDWKKYRVRYEEGCRLSPNSTRTKEYKDLRDYNYIRFMECMDRLGYKY